MRLNPHRVAEMIYKQIIVKGDIAFSLEQGFVRIFIEKIAVNKVPVVDPGTTDRPVPNEYIGPRQFLRSTLPFAENIVADNGCTALYRHAWQHPSGLLMFNLQVVAMRVNDQIALDQARDKRRASI